MQGLITASALGKHAATTQPGTNTVQWRHTLRGSYTHTLSHTHNAHISRQDEARSEAFFAWTYGLHTYACMVWNVPKAAGSCLTTSNWPKYLHLNPPARRYCYFCDLRRMQMTLFGVSGSHWSPASCSRRLFCLSLGWFRLRCRAGQGGTGSGQTMRPRDQKRRHRHTLQVAEKLKPSGFIPEVFWHFGHSQEFLLGSLEAGPGSHDLQETFPTV